MIDTKNPQVSVIIPSYNSIATIDRCLGALETQRTNARFEVIVVDSSTDGTSNLIRNRFPDVLLHMSSQRMYPGGARNIGADIARGEILAFVDADCCADPHWIENIVSLHKEEHLLIGGAVDNGNPKSYVGWGYYFCEFSHWLPGTSAGRMKEIPTCCLSMKRVAFERYGPFQERGYCSDTAFNRKVVQDGHELVFSPSIKVAHINIEQVGRFLAHEPMHGEAFSRLRVQEEEFSSSRRALYILCAPLLPVILWLRIAARTVRTNSYVKPFVWATPVVIIGLVAWSFGEMVGYVKGRR